MYFSFYGLKQKPFQMSTNPNFVWLGKLHKKVLALLQYGILQNQGFFLLSGDVGTGKTTLVNALIVSLGDDVVVAKVPDPGLELIDFLNYISHAFGMDKRFVCKEDFLIHFDRFLQTNAVAGKKVLLIIDEAQRLNSTLLEEIRQLSNIEKQQTKALNILFAGQNLFNDFLQESQNRALSQRISIKAAIGPLNLDETAEYIRQSLKNAGAEKDIFSADAVHTVHEYSGGFLRRINIICDHAMLLGYLKGKKTVNVDMVRQCAEDLCLPDATVQLTPNPLHGIDGSDVENLQDIPPEPVQKIASIQAWKIIGAVILIVIGVFAATYFNYPQEYRTLFSRIQKNGLQALHLSPETDLVYPVNILNNAEPLQETAKSEIPVTTKVAKVSETTAMDMVAAEDHLVEKMAPPQIVLEEQSTDDRLEEPFAASDTVDTVDLDAIPPIEEKSVVEVHPSSVQINALSFSEQQTRSGEDTSKNIPALTENAPVLTPETDSSHEGSEALDVSETIETLETIVPVEIPAQFVDSSVAEKETGTDPVAAGTSGEPDSTSYADLIESMIEKTTDDMPGVAVDPVYQEGDPAEPEEEAEEAVEAVEAVEETPADVDPSAVIDWVIKKRSE